VHPPIGFLAANAHRNFALRRTAARRSFVFIYVMPDVRYWHLADIPSCTAHVRYGGKADMVFCVANVCFRPIADMKHTR
jgi:hypothetical protein